MWLQRIMEKRAVTEDLSALNGPNQWKTNWNPWNNKECARLLMNYELCDGEIAVWWLWIYKAKWVPNDGTSPDSVNHNTCYGIDWHRTFPSVAFTTSIGVTTPSICSLDIVNKCKFHQTIWHQMCFSAHKSTTEATSIINVYNVYTPWVWQHRLLSPRVCTEFINQLCYWTHITITPNEQ